MSNRTRWPWIGLALWLIVLAAAWPELGLPGLLNTRGGGDSPFLLQRLQQLETEEPFVITEAGLDYVGGKFLQRVRLPGRLAQRLFAFCPDIVDQGTGSVANLERELSKPSPPLYLWWD